MSYHIVEIMLKKAEEAEARGDTKWSEHWLKRAEETEKRMEELNKEGK